MLDFTIEQVVTDRFSMEYIHFGTGKTPMVVLPGLGVKSVIESAPAVVSHSFHPDLSHVGLVLGLQPRSVVPAGRADGHGAGAAAKWQRIRRRL